MSACTSAISTSIIYSLNTDFFNECMRVFYTNISLTTTAADTVLSFYRIFDTESMFEQLLFISTLHGTRVEKFGKENIVVLCPGRRIPVRLRIRPHIYLSIF